MSSKRDFAYARDFVLLLLLLLFAPLRLPPRDLEKKTFEDALSSPPIIVLDDASEARLPADANGADAHAPITNEKRGGGVFENPKSAVVVVVVVVVRQKKFGFLRGVF